MSAGYHQRLMRYSRNPLHRFYLARAYAAGLAQLQALGRAPLAKARPRVLLCGTGAPETTDAFQAFVRARARRASLVVIDVAFEALSRSRGRDAPLAQADARALPFGDGSFDLIETDFLLQFLSGEDRLSVMQEWRRLLDPSSGGLMTRDYFPGNSWAERALDAGRRALLKSTLGAPIFDASYDGLLTLGENAGLTLRVDRPRLPKVALALPLPLVRLVAAVPARRG